MGRNTAGMELKCEKFKHSGHYPRTEDSAGSRHRSCTALPLLTSEAYRDICKDGISPFSMVSVHTMFGQTCSGGSRLFAGDSPSSSWSSDSLVWAAFDNQLCMRGTAHSSERDTVIQRSDVTTTHYKGAVFFHSGNWNWVQICLWDQLLSQNWAGPVDTRCHQHLSESLAIRAEANVSHHVRHIDISADRDSLSPIKSKIKSMKVRSIFQKQLK